MNFEQIKALCDDNVELIAYSKEGLREATSRATQFLIVVSLLAEYRLDLERRKAKISTMREAFYSHEISKAEGKNITEKKVIAEASKTYTDQREATEEIEGEISWTKTMMNIFESAHVTYRQMARGD